MRFYSSFTALLGAAMRNETVLKRLIEQAKNGEVVLLTAAGLGRVIGPAGFAAREVTWTGVDGVKPVYYDRDDSNALVRESDLPVLLRERWLLFKDSVLRVLQQKGLLICNANPDDRNWYIHTIVSHGHVYMLDLTVGWDGDIVPELQGPPPAEVYINLAHIIELTPEEQAIAQAAVTHEVN